jgi:hypothetical protein
MGIVKRSIFRMKAQQMFDVYTRTFSRAAHQFNSYIVAGKERNRNNSILITLKDLLFCPRLCLIEALLLVFD